MSNNSRVVPSNRCRTNRWSTDINQNLAIEMGHCVCPKSMCLHSVCWCSGRCIRLPWVVSGAERPLWAPLCKELKDRHLSGPDLNILFSPKPRRLNMHAHWVLAWKNVDVLIPRTSYQDIFVSVNKQNDYEVILVTTDGALIGLMSNEDEAMEDIFAQSTLQGENILSSWGVATTRELFGGPVRLSTLMRLAYDITPDMLTCLEAHRVRESAMAVAFIVKGVGSGILTAAYDDLGNYNGWITRSTAEENIIYDLNIIPADSDNRYLLIHYKLPKDSPYEYLPLVMGSNLPPSKGTPPSWLRALNTALTYGTHDRWQTFVAAAGKASISEKSLSRTAKALTSAPGP